MQRTARLLARLLLAALLLAGCAPGQTVGTTSSAAPARSLTVFAAASLQKTFTVLGKTFEASHPGVTVVINFAGSQTLASQLVEGASADVFASANETQMKVVTDAGLATGQPTIFATNQLMIAVPPDNPAGIASFGDLTRKGLALVVCAPAVPCGAATQKVEQATGVRLDPVSEEQSVTAVLSKVQTGEADAGLVYRTDVIAAGGSVRGITFPESGQAVNRNPIVLLKGAPRAELGRAWIDLVLGAQGQSVLADAGFGGAP